MPLNLGKKLGKTALLGIIIAPYIGIHYMWKLGIDIANANKEHVAFHHQCHFETSEVPSFCNDFIIAEEVGEHRT